MLLADVSKVYAIASTARRQNLPNNGVLKLAIAHGRPFYGGGLLRQQKRAEAGCVSTVSVLFASTKQMANRSANCDKVTHGAIMRSGQEAMVGPKGGRLAPTMSVSISFRGSVLGRAGIRALDAEGEIISLAVAATFLV